MMKKLYIRPQARIVTLNLIGSVLLDRGIGNASYGVNTTDDTSYESRRGNVFDDDDEEENTGGWFK